MDDLDPKQRALVRLGTDRVLCHQTLFRHRHPDAIPAFHPKLIRSWHNPAFKNVLDLVFRGGAKSTIAEEAIIIRACFREFRNGLIVGSNYDRAAQRLHAIRREFEGNEMLHELFGDLCGRPWGDDKIELANGTVIQALGRGQSLRGIKEGDLRPDLLFCDDLEERVDMRTPESRAKISDWHALDLIPALDPRYLERMAATPLHPESLPMKLAGDGSWEVNLIPIYYLNDEGKPVSSWEDRFPIKTVLNQEKAAAKRGQLLGWRAEYLCQAEAPESKAFKEEMILVEPQVRSWQAVYSMTDPARTTSATSATTGHVVWSWVGARLVVWDAWARRIMPDEIIEALFETYEEHHPVWLGIEEDGLNQFLMQPIRQAMVKRGTPLPVKAMKAPNSKLDFIRGLQPFFAAREVRFAKPMPDLKTQLLGFPSGEIDAPNALAYALKMRPGAPIYDDFNGARHVGEDLTPASGLPVWLCLNATRSVVTGALVQVIDGSIRIYADYLREGDAVSTVADIIALATLDAGRTPRLTGGPLHFDQYNNVGLRQAIARIPMTLERGAPPANGQPHLTSLLQRERRSMPMLMVSSEARWTLNAFAGGYSRALLKQGHLAAYAEEGEYRVLMEGIESFAGRLHLGGSPDDQDDGRNYATAANGRRYLTTLPQRG